MTQFDDFKKILSQPTEAAPQPTEVAPQPTATAPQPTATAPGDSLTALGMTGGGLGGDAKNLGGDAKKPGDNITLGGKTYRVEQVLGSGSEGDIYVVSEGRHRYALKLCHKGFKTNQKVLQALRSLNKKGYIADIVEYGEDYELAKYVPGGSADKAGLKGNAQAILTLVVKTAMILDEMHRCGVIHKDIKPANILITDPSAWDCVLCDFGISDLLNSRGTSITPQVRTPIYAAPEVYATGNTINRQGVIYCELSPKADFYSLGMTILALWMGEGAFLQKEAELAIDKRKGRITIPADMPDPLAKICRGLLIGDPSKRWDYPEIEATLRGKDVEVDEDLLNPDLDINYNASKHLRANTPEELAQCMADDLELAVRYLYSGKIERWLRPYPELAMEVEDITEHRYREDRETGAFAVMFLLNPKATLPFSGTSRTTGEHIQRDVRTLKDVADFCNDADPDEAVANLICGDVFREWVRVRDKEKAADLPTAPQSSTTFLLRVQTLDPLSDINLINKPDHPHYAMTGEGIGRLLNEVYTIFWNRFGGDVNKMLAEWEDGPILKAVAANIAVNFLAPEDYHYITGFFDTKGRRFEKQRSWFVYCTNRNSDDYTKRAGPKDDVFHAQASWMKCIRGFGYNAEYEFVDTGKTAQDRRELFEHSKKELRLEYRERGLRGFLALCHQEHPEADLTPRFAYETLLQAYIEDVGDIDPDDPAYVRYDKARDEAQRLISEGKGKIGRLSFRTTWQTILAVALGFIPGLILLAMLIFSIIENPLIDVSGMRLEYFTWILGGIIAAIVFFEADTEGCLVPIIAGAIGGVLITILVKFLGQFILYLYALIVLAVLGWFTYRILILQSSFAKDARKFTKPGFDEKVLEPLYFAFNNERAFDSSLNGAFNDQDIHWWKEDVKSRSKNNLIFIAAVWFLMIFSLFIPKSERFDKLSAPVVEKVTGIFTKKDAAAYDLQTLRKGKPDRG